MKVLLVGNGAREHAIAERLAQDAELYAVMSKKNPAIAQLSKKYWICDIENAGAVAKVVSGNDFDLGFASPDASLAAGVSDALAGLGMLVASPSKSASRIEWDKSFMRHIMDEYGIKGNPLHVITNDPKEAARAIRDYGDVAVKPLGLTGGKGVRVSGDHFQAPEEAAEYAESLIKKDGSVLVEEKLVGEEFTFQAFCDGSRVCVMPAVQDHKRAFEGDAGPNTGGMGSYSTGMKLPFLDDADLEDAKKTMVATLHALRKEGAEFHGVLYGQFMATKKSVKLIEYNARFGDPEAVNVVSLLKGSLPDTLLSMAEGRLDPPAFEDAHTVVKYLVPEGYPDKPVKDAPVEVDAMGMEDCSARAYYASVYENSGKTHTTSSRAFAILGKAKTLAEAEQIAERGCSHVKGPVWHRKDIGTAALVGKRVEHMRSLRGGGK